MAKEKKLTTEIAGVPPSTEIRQRLKAENRPVLVAFSCGKDAICTELALSADGIDTELAYLYYIPGLQFIEDGIKSLEDQLQKKIHKFPHPSLYRWLSRGVFQTPERTKVIEAAELVQIEYDEVWALIREHLGLSEDTWLADGVRANDSQQRRMAFTKYGAIKDHSSKVSPIWDWSIENIRLTLQSNNIKLPVDYDLFGRSFDGLDFRFTGPIKENFPEDYEIIRSWFPLVDLEQVRRGL